jgi:hypothetical protein
MVALLQTVAIEVEALESQSRSAVRLVSQQKQSVVRVGELTRRLARQKRLEMRSDKKSSTMAERSLANATANVPPGVENLVWPLKSTSAVDRLSPTVPDEFFMPMPFGIVIAAHAWALLLLLTWACPWLSWEFKQQHADRIMGGVHAVIATIFGLAAEFGTYAQCTVGRSWTVTAIQMTVGYMLVDLVSMTICDVWQKWRPSDPLMFAHHFYVVVFFSAGGLLDVGVWFFVIGMINEASTPLLSVLMIVKYVDSQSTWLMPIGMSFAVMFFLCRILFLPYSYYQYASLGFCDGGTPAQAFSAALAKPCYAFIYALNCYWFYRTILGATKALKGGKMDRIPFQDALREKEQQVPNPFKAAPRFGPYRYRLQGS